MNNGHTHRRTEDEDEPQSKNSNDNGGDRPTNVTALARKGRRALKRQAAAERRRTDLPTTFTPKFLDNSDNRLAVVRQIKKRIEALMQDGGGNESTQRAMLCRHAAFLHVLLETQETELAETGQFEMGVFVQAVNSLVGLLRMLGLEKRIKRAGGIGAYIEEKEAQS
jgi:hypothetical protein